MKKYALVFSGQGSERVGMFSGIDKDPLIEILDELKSKYCIDMHDIVNTKDAALISTNNQVLLSLFHYLGAKAVVDTIGYLPTVMMGHSVGQFSAIANSGAVSFVDMVNFLTERTRIINAEHVELRAKFKSIHGMTKDDFESFIQHEKLETDIELALHNQKEQIVCGVTEAGECKLNALSSKYNFVLKDVNVSRPYHTSFMEEYNQMLLPHINALSPRKPLCPVLMNYSKEMTIDAEQMLAESREQMVKPVFWYESVMNAAEQVEAFVTIDPGETQHKIIKRITDKKIHNVSGMVAIKMIEKRGL